MEKTLKNLGLLLARPCYGVGTLILSDHQIRYFSAREDDEVEKVGFGNGIKVGKVA